MFSGDHLHRACRPLKHVNVIFGLVILCQSNRVWRCIIVHQLVYQCVGSETPILTSSKLRLKWDCYVKKTLAHWARGQRKWRRAQSNWKKRLWGWIICVTYGRLAFIGSVFVQRRFRTVCLIMPDWIPLLETIIDMLRRCVNVMLRSCRYLWPTWLSRILDAFSLLKTL